MPIDVSGLNELLEDVRFLRQISTETQKRKRDEIGPIFL